MEKINKRKYVMDKNTHVDISKEDLIEQYIYQNKSREKCGEFFHCSPSWIRHFIKKYNIVKTKEQIQLTREQTCLEHYGVAVPQQNHEIQAKTQKTVLSKYGTTNVSQNEQIKRKIKEVFLSKYGCSCSLHNLQVAKKAKNTMIKKYGCDNPLKCDDIKKQIQATNIKKYGYAHPMQNKEIKNKIIKTNIQKYGVYNPIQHNIQHYDIWSNDTYLANYIKSFNKNITLYEISQYFNIDISTASRKIISLQLCPYVNYESGYSHYEYDIQKILQQFGINNIILHDRTVLGGQEIDIYLPDYKFGIEFNGNYWHCDLHDRFQDHNGRSITHQQKSLLAESKGIQLFHIFEYEWVDINQQNKIIKRIKCILKKNKYKIAARNCVVKEISKEDKNVFLDKNHVQGRDTQSNYYLGLYYQDLLVACMTFGHSKYKKYNYELIRFATLIDYNVQGGASKLFKYFIKNRMQPNEVIASYNDIAKTSGKIYQTLDFKCVSINSPNYI